MHIPLLYYTIAKEERVVVYNYISINYTVYLGVQLRLKSYLDRGSISNKERVAGGSRKRRHLLQKY